jgi:hypothetical protein
MGPFAAGLEDGLLHRMVPGPQEGGEDQRQ